MTTYWLQPSAWWGLMALAIPLLIHLLARQQRRRLPFPSLRFLRASRLSALRQRSLSDWPLLIVRLLVIGMAVAALASPVFVSAERQQYWINRVTRAIVRVPYVTGSTDQVAREVDQLVAEERATAFSSATFLPVRNIADAVVDAVAWLEQQPPASREVVVIGDLRADSLPGHDVASIPRAIGVRFLPVIAAVRPRDLQRQSVALAPDGSPVLRHVHITLADDATDAHYRSGGVLPSLPIEVRASRTDQTRVDAALRAVLSTGVVLPRDDRHVIVEFEGGANSAASAFVRPARHLWMRHALERLADLQGGERDGRLVITTGVPGTDPRAVGIIARIVRVAFADDLRDREPRVIPASLLADWSRPPSPDVSELRPGDEGDRRYFWFAVLILLVFEHVLRRSRTTTSLEPVVIDQKEARVA